jgi:molybdate transport system regulatory protein
MKIRHKIWLERNDKVIFGQGREKILEAIEECHSLNAAAKKLQMSYRAAWARLKASEERAGIKLVESDGAGKGMRLTPEAKELLVRFKKMERETNALMEKFGRQFSLQDIKPGNEKEGSIK